MAKLSVKVATVKLIEALEKRLIQIVSDYEKQPEIIKKYDKEREKWQTECLDFVKTFGKYKYHGAWVCGTSELKVNCEIIVDKNDFRPEPVYPTVISNNDFEKMVQEINNAIAILKLTDEPFVNTSTYSAVTKYL